MKTASISEIRSELKQTPNNELLDLCLRLAKHKKENKELLSYLLFDKYNQQAFLDALYTDVDEMYEAMNTSSVYYIKKTVRKIIRHINRYIKYASQPKIEVELRIYLCSKLQLINKDIQKSVVLKNLYSRELDRIRKAHALLHEDLQFDYTEAINNLEV